MTRTEEERVAAIWRRAYVPYGSRIGGQTRYRLDPAAAADLARTRHPSAVPHLVELAPDPVRRGSRSEGQSPGPAVMEQLRAELTHLLRRVV